MHNPECDVTRIEAILEDLFQSAKRVDEFEYICAFMRAARGLYTESQDSLREVRALYMDVLHLTAQPLRQETLFRMGLLTYCHLIEADALYEILGNMLRVLQGERCIPEPLPQTPGKAGIVKYLVERASILGKEDLASLLGRMYCSSIRNAFSHSDYVLDERGMCTTKGRFDIDGMKTNFLEYGRVLEIITGGVGFFNSTLNTIDRHRKSYRADVVLTPRLATKDGLNKVRILADECRGVYGLEFLC
ncbi:MAG: hypothetical protein RBU21_02725 [FCB group bacterium]|jgi:hypothetical protein|nr:hypothetical protein [FCB group bacterium]